MRKTIILLFALLLGFSCSIEEDKDIPIVPENGRDGVSIDIINNADGSTTLITYLDEGGEDRNFRFDEGERWFKRETFFPPRDGVDGRDGSSFVILQETFVDEEGRQCILITSFEDIPINGVYNGVYDEGIDELVSSDSICSGTDGNDGRSLVVVTRDATEAECSSGGTVTRITYDDGTLVGEYKVCNGTNGTNGTDGNNGNDGENGTSSMITSEIIGEGEYGCQHGGLKIVIMNDKNADGDFEDEGEVTVRIICNLKCPHEEPPCEEEEFVYTMDFEEFNTGDIVDQVIISGNGTCDQTVSVFGDNPHLDSNQAMIFDSGNPTGGDTDLSSSYLGNILIVSEDGDSSDPDDARFGNSGVIMMFEVDTEVISVDIIDADHEQNPVIKAFDVDGNLLGMVDIPLIGQNSIQTIDLGFSNVRKLKFWFEGSMALDNLKLRCNTICE